MSEGVSSPPPFCVWGDICLVTAEDVQKARILSKILNNEALKMFKFGDEGFSSSTQCSSSTGGSGGLSANSNSNNQQHRHAYASSMQRATGKKHSTTAAPVRKMTANNNTEQQQHCHGVERVRNRHPNKIAQNPTDSLNGMAVCSMNDDVILTNWQNNNKTIRSLTGGVSDDDVLLLMVGGYGGDAFASSADIFLPPSPSAGDEHHHHNSPRLGMVTFPHLNVVRKWSSLGCFLTNEFSPYWV
ncbi:hypothetical protein niasHT_017421 [Heterodera trifolii]|uniref:Uncharacterized protein n=1 Tax=Heterodera trifolii TaxID=157864 RepID=A0ABD2LHK5_9BILA